MQDPHVVTTRLHGVWGMYDLPNHTIYLDDRLNGTQRRCTLTHETIHAERGDTALPDTVLNARQERLVHQEAARRLIPVDDLVEAVRWAGEMRELAEILDVDLGTLQARLDALSQVERTLLEQIASARD